MPDVLVVGWPKKAAARMATAAKAMCSAVSVMAIGTPISTCEEVWTLAVTLYASLSEQEYPP